MTGLPQHIEAYLQEAGFSATELIVLNKLLEKDAMTLREMAALTGKSTGVLSQAVKKLVRRNIVFKGMINDTPKYMLDSLDAISRWVENHTHAKQEILHRKHQDFESFLGTLKLDKARPDMEHFEGEGGLMQAYEKLLGLTNRELLHYYPITYKEEDDPLRPFRVQYFRKRHKKKIFSRIIAPDTPIGRRYQSRDCYEYRETVLIPEEQFPFAFEKIIADNAIACFNHKEERATIIRYADLAEVERGMFEVVWNTKIEVQQVNDDKIPAQTKTVSAVRDFLISIDLIKACIICSIFALSTTLLLLSNSNSISKERVRDTVKAIAATAAPEINWQDLEILRGLDDVNRKEYERTVRQLQSIRERNEDVVYTYIMRPTDSLYYYEFVADADSLDIHSDIDLNEDGLRNDMVAPGHIWYDDDPNTSALLDGFFMPAADQGPTKDIWGFWISGHAPIKNDSGETVAIIGIDMNANMIQEISRKNFVPMYVFLGFFVLFIFLRFMAFRSPILPPLKK